MVSAAMVSAAMVSAAMVSAAIVGMAVASVAAVGKALVGGCLTMRTHPAGLHSPCVQHTMQVMEAEEFVRRLCAPRGYGGDERVYMQALTHYGPTHYGPTHYGPLLTMALLTTALLTTALLTTAVLAMAPLTVTLPTMALPTRSLLTILTTHSILTMERLSMRTDAPPRYLVITPTADGRAPLLLPITWLSPPWQTDVPPSLLRALKATPPFWRGPTLTLTLTLTPTPTLTLTQGAGGGYSETIVDLSSWSAVLEPGEVVRIA